LAPKGLKAALKEMACGEPDVAPFVRPHRLQMNAARGMLVLKAVLSTAQAYSLGALVDAAIARSLPAAALWLGIMAGVAAAKALDQRFYSLESGRLRIAVRRGVRLAVFEALSRTPSPGEAPDRLAARLTADANRVVVKNVSIPIQFPHLVIQSALACAFLVKASPWMAALVLGSLPLLGALARRYGRRCARLQERACTQSAAMTQEGARLLSRAPMEGEESGRAAARYRRASDRFEGTMLEYARAGADFDGIREALQAAGTELLVLGLGLLGYILTGSPSIGQVMALRGYAKDLRGAVDGIIDAYTGSKDAEGGTRRILELLRLGRPPATEP
jgi:ABC-type multidrug transport system fused ATPase/permease subunit